MAQGKYPVTLAPKSTVVESFVNAGAPLKSIIVKEVAPVSSGALNIFAFDKAPHPAAQRLFINWMLSKEAGEIIRKTTGYASERVDVSREGIDPALVPGHSDVVETEEYNYLKGSMDKVAVRVFRDYLK